MAERHELRVSDRERQLAADRLRAAMDEGRLDLFEYDSRLSRAYQSATYADLDRLFGDLPAVSQPGQRPAPAAEKPPRPASKPGPVSGLPLPLKILWTVWGAVVAINLTVWILVSLSNGSPEYLWPAWFLIPGVALLSVTVGVQAIRRSR